MKKYLSILLSVLLLLAALPLSVVSVSAADEFAGGNGTESNPYLVSTKAQLNNVRNYLNAHFLLTADLVFAEADFEVDGPYYNDSDCWEPIGKFSGVFDGGDHTIYNLKVDTVDDYAGLFGKVSGTVCNLRLSNANIQGDSYLGALCGYNSGTIRNVRVLSSSVLGTNYVGGICGDSDGPVSACFMSGSVTATGDTAGGIVGYAENRISQCYNTATVAAVKNAGGIAGHLLDESVSLCVNEGNVSGNHAGAIVGYTSFGPSYITNCFNKSQNYVNIHGGTITNAACRIGNCYNLKGSISAYGVSVTGCYTTSDDLTDKRTFIDWDFDTVWTMAGDVNYPYPELRCFTLQGAAAIEGTVAVGETVSASFVSSVNQPNSLTYEWYVDNVLVDSGDTYTITAAAEGKELKVRAVSGDVLCAGHVASAVYTVAPPVDPSVPVIPTEPSDDGFVKNGDFETGKGAPWTLYSGSNVSADAAYTGDYGLICTNPNGGWGGTAFQNFSVESGKSYEVTMWAKAIAQGQSIQIQNGGANVAFNWFTATEWTLLTFEFTATATDVRINICGGGTGANEMVYFDDIKVKELIDPSFDGYIYNGDFETGEVFPWDNLWGSNTVEIVEGMDGYGLHIVSGQWRHVRQTNIAVEPNTNYKITAWAKNTAGMSLLVKDGGDSKDIVNADIEAGEEWTEFTAEFNSGNNTTIIVSLMGNNAEAAFGTFDNVSIVEMAPTIWVSTSEATAGDEIEVQVKLLNNPGVIAATVEILYDKDVMELVTYFDEEEEMWLPQIEVGATYNASSNKYITFGPIDEETGIARKCVVSYIRGTANSNCTKEDFFTATFKIKDDAPCGTYPLTVSYDPQNFFAMGVVDVAFGKQDGSVTVTCAHANWDPCTGICPDCGKAVKPAHGNIIAVDAKDATCTEDGNVAYWYCDACGQVWLDEARTLNTTPEAVILPALGHNSVVHIAAKNSTCIENGNIEYWYCADCNKAWLDGNYTLPISLKAVFLPLEDHTYDDKYDAGCNVCGHIREVPVRPIFGDASGDGVVNGRDMALLQQYMADWDVIMDKAAADVNDNGVINARDVALLQQYIAGWDVKLG